MEQSQSQLSVLLVGRIYEEQEVFRWIQVAVKCIAAESKTTTFFLTDARTKDKVAQWNPELQCVEFIPSQHHEKISFIVTIGGDGTILYAAKEFKSSIPPVITFQKGTLGFMCRFSLAEMEEVLTKVVKQFKDQVQTSFQQVNLMRLDVVRIDKRQELQTSCKKVCINEVYISRKSHERITLQIIVNGEVFTHTAGDGILISTPTGSTAYSLSAGGPILDNGVNAILIVPISPNSLSFRPICLPSNSNITIKLHSSSRSQAYASFDGQSIENIDFAHELQISRSKHDLTFYEPRKDEAKLPSWIQRLKYFLGWNEKYKAPIEQYSPETINTPVCRFDKQ